MSRSEARKSTNHRVGSLLRSIGPVVATLPDVSRKGSDSSFPRTVRRDENCDSTGVFVIEGDIIGPVAWTAFHWRACGSATHARQRKCGELRSRGVVLVWCLPHPHPPPDVAQMAGAARAQKGQHIPRTRCRKSSTVSGAAGCIAPPDVLA